MLVSMMVVSQVMVLSQVMMLSQEMVLNHTGIESDPHWKAIYESLRTYYNHFVFFFSTLFMVFFYEIMVFTYCSALIQHSV